MRKNNKGFTLIELLAVLIVISLIALITVTNVSKMLSKSKDTLYSNQVKQIEKAARVWGADHIMILPSDSNSENTCNYDEIEECDKKYKTLIITLKTLQDGGYIDKDIKNPKNNKIIDPDTIITITKNGKSIDYKVDLDDGSSFAGTIDTSKQYSTAHVEQLGLKGVAYLDPINLKTKCDASKAVSTTGTKTGCMKFYIFDDSGDTYKMILDHNTTTHVKWSSSGNNADGMKEVATALSTDTTGWTSGLNPRLITANEVASITNATKFDGNSSTWFYFDGTGTNKQTQASSSRGDNEYAWLFDYTNGCESYGCNSTDSSTTGYWTSSPVSDNLNSAWHVNGSGRLIQYTIGNWNLFGVRPVIEIDKSIIDGDDEDSSESSTSEPKSFATDDWNVIAANTTSNVYNVGDEKKITLNINGTDEEYTLVIVNKTACTTETSESACGFVVQFKETLNITNNDDKKMNTTNTNVGGWPASAMYTYLNNTIYPKLKAEIGDIIIDTKTVSGHGSTSGETNFISNNDKLYLLSTKEVGLDVSQDTAKSETRKLDYYVEGTGADANVKRIKYNYGTETPTHWWLRSAYSNTTYFFNVSDSGSSAVYVASSTYGVAPAFRIGK